MVLQAQPIFDGVGHAVNKEQRTGFNQTTLWSRTRGIHGSPVIQTRVETHKTGEHMNILHLLIAIDIAFAGAVWYIYKDHKKKMDALYERYDKKNRERSKSDHLRLDK
jgi:uncharacterized ferritin-like protein (DUF455 family)